ncbi:MAG: carboxypeptidase-like regulatory domain-containing protein [Candidatus Cryptobacteroides sp.]
MMTSYGGTMRSGRHALSALLLLLTALLLTARPLSAQSRNAAGLEISGTVTTVENGRKVPLEGAVVLLKPAGLYSSVDAEGKWRFQKLDEGEYSLSVQMIGYVTIDTTILVRKAGRTHYDFTMEISSFRLEEVSIVAEGSKAGEATASLISRQAIDHALTSSLSDVMQLLPGVGLSNPNLSSAQSLNLRTAVSSAMNSLGTAIIMDGSPMSNNANMEGITSAMTGTASTIAGTSTFDAGSVPNSGIDVRTISTDNIESVEVIRGIPSVQYGDLTSGAVIVNSKAGVEPLTIRFKTDPKIYQVSASKGFKLGGRAGSINVSGDYAYSNAKTTEAYANYRRMNFKTVYSNTFGQLSSTTSLDLRFGKDVRNPNPDDFRSRTASGGTNYGYRFNTNGTWNINSGWMKSVRYDLSNSLTWKDSFKEQMCSNATALYTNNMVDGSVVTNVPGRHLYDTEGNEITNFSPEQAAEGAYAIYMPDSYFSHYDFYSKELNTYAKVTANLFKSWGATSEKILAGADFKSDGNLGRGLVFPEGTPPPQGLNSESGYRERPLYDIPFVNQTGLFAESIFHTQFAKGRDLNLSAGLRYDIVGSLSALSPRVNLSFDILPEALTLRGGYGITAKAPTSAYLYPNNAYCDQTLFNNDVSNPDDKYVIASTRIFDTSNPDLEIARNRKMEIGLDITIARRYTLNITFFDELMKNGYGFGSGIGTFVLLPYVKYSMSGTDENGNPTFEMIRNDKKFFRWYTPSNNKYEHNLGLEYELNLGRFDAIRTSFYLNGAWMRTQTANSGYTFDFRQQNGSYVGSNVSIYEPFVSRYNYEKFVSTLRITHNIPAIGFVVTLTTGFNAYTRSWTDYNNDEIPQYYLSAEDGQMYVFTEEMASDPAFKYMYETKSASRFTVSKTIPTVVFNLNLSKEIGKSLTASFYVNNIFNSRPLDPSEVGAATFTELNNPMYFGFELKVKLFN